MPPPNNTQDLPQDAELIRQPNGQIVPSQALVQLLCKARSGYDWPAGTGAKVSQQTILDLEASVAAHLSVLNPNSAHSIVIDVSRWAGNNANAHAAIVNATNAKKSAMEAAITKLCSHGQEAEGLDSLCNLPGIRLVIASKIFRFCAPLVGAAVDRHASYFFNSLSVLGNGLASNFKREWSNGRHTGSRLAIYTLRNYERNRTEYIEIYLPLLADIADAFNAVPAPYTCAAINQERNWTPADIEMAAYYWWACNGSR